MRDDARWQGVPRGTSPRGISLRYRLDRHDKQKHDEPEGDIDGARSLGGDWLLRSVANGTSWPDRCDGSFSS